jgi:hypothetical protein
MQRLAAEAEFGEQQSFSHAERRSKSHLERFIILSSAAANGFINRSLLQTFHKGIHFPPIINASMT